jgi:hypothetical protein
LFFRCFDSFVAKEICFIVCCIYFMLLHPVFLSDTLLELSIGSSTLDFARCFVNSKARHGVVLKGESLFV